MASTTRTNLRSIANTENSSATDGRRRSDDVEHASYRVFRNGVEVDTTTSMSYTYGGLSCGVTYTHLHRLGYDAAANTSGSQSLASVTTQQAPDTEAPSSASNLSDGRE